MSGKKQLGLIINPIAGMGGRVALKGTDGRDILARAKALGAEPLSGLRAQQALRSLAAVSEDIKVLTASGEMGELAASQFGFETEVVYHPAALDTSSEDTVKAAEALLTRKVDLILFAGGDGTARDICRVIGEQIPVIGIPAGVKIQSAVFALTPQKAGELAAGFIRGTVSRTRAQDVLDLNEEAYCKGSVISKLFGCMKVPYDARYLQGKKTGSSATEEAEQEAIALAVIDNMDPDTLYMIGPGSTTRPIMTRLGLPYTLIGVDAVLNRQIAGLDLNEQQILALVEQYKCRLIVTPIGGQGYLFGRGNQQLSPHVLNKLGLQNLIVVATRHKLSTLQGRPLRVDTGDMELDAQLSGYVPIITAYFEKTIYRIES